MQSGFAEVDRKGILLNDGGKPNRGNRNIIPGACSLACFEYSREAMLASSGIMIESVSRASVADFVPLIIS